MHLCRHKDVIVDLNALLFPQMLEAVNNNITVRRVFEYWQPINDSVRDKVWTITLAKEAARSGHVMLLLFPQGFNPCENRTLNPCGNQSSPRRHHRDIFGWQLQIDLISATHAF